MKQLQNLKSSKKIFRGLYQDPFQDQLSLSYLPQQYTISTEQAQNQLNKRKGEESYEDTIQMMRPV